MSEHFITPHELAARWRMTPEALANWRARKIGPRFVKAGDGPRARVLYRMSEIKIFEKERAA